MKREDVLGIFPNATDEEIDRILNRVGGELNPLKRKLADAEKDRDAARADQGTALAKAAGLEQQLAEATEKLKAGMTAEELLADQQAEAERLRSEYTLKANGLEAKAMFVEAGFFDAAEIDALVEKVTTEDAAATKAFAESLIGTVRKQREAVEKATRDELLKGNPNPQGGSGAGATMTREEFRKLPYKDQLAMKAENPDIISQLRKE